MTLGQVAVHMEEVKLDSQLPPHARLQVDSRLTCNKRLAHREENLGEYFYGLGARNDVFFLEINFCVHHNMHEKACSSGKPHRMDPAKKRDTTPTLGTSPVPVGEKEHLRGEQRQPQGQDA